MAKKKAKATKITSSKADPKTMSLADKLKLIDSLSNDINKNANKSIIGRIGTNEEMQEKLEVEFIPTPSLKINTMFGGGFARRNISIICGAPDSGKTMYLLETIALNQKLDPNFVALWLESEASLKMEALNMFGIDTNRFVILKHDREGAGEEAINRIEASLAMGVYDMVVINSLKCLVPSEEFAKDMNSVQVGAQSRLNAKMMRKLTSLVEEYNCAMVIVQHLTTQIGVMHGDPMTLAGGNAIRYGAMLIADFRKVSVGPGEPIDKEEGMKINVYIRKNHVMIDKYPYQSSTYYVIYNQGVEKYMEALALAVEQGLIEEKKPYYKIVDENGEAKIVDGVKMQWQGLAKFRQYCIENPQFYEDLTDALDCNSIYSEECEECDEYGQAKNSGDEEEIDIELDLKEPIK